MRESQSTYAIFQIGLGIIVLLIGVSGFILESYYLLYLEAIFMGLGVLLHGLANNNKDKPERGKTLSKVGSVFYFLGVILILYNLFFNSK